MTVDPRLLAGLRERVARRKGDVVMDDATLLALLDEIARLKQRLAEKVDAHDKDGRTLVRYRDALDHCRLRAGYLQHHCQNITEARLEGAAIEAAVNAAFGLK